MPEFTVVGLSLFAIASFIKKLHEWDMLDMLPDVANVGETFHKWFGRVRWAVFALALYPLGPAIDGAGRTYLAAWHVLDDQGREANTVIGETIRKNGGA